MSATPPNFLGNSTTSAPAARMPVTMIIAVVLAWIIAVAITGLGVFLLVLAAQAVSPSGSALLTGFVMVMASLVAVAGLVQILAVTFMMRGRNWGRVVLTVLFLISPALGVIMMTTAPTDFDLITLAGLAVIVLMFVPPSSAWFRAKRTERLAAAGRYPDQNPGNYPGIAHGYPSGGYAPPPSGPTSR